MDLGEMTMPERLCTTHRVPSPAPQQPGSKCPTLTTYIRPNYLKKRTAALSNEQRLHFLLHSTSRTSIHCGYSVLGGFWCDKLRSKMKEEK